MRTAREKTQEFLARVDASVSVEAARPIAAEFHAYYATLTGPDKQEADQVLHEMVVEQGRRIDEAIARMETAAAPLVRATSEK